MIDFSFFKESSPERFTGHLAEPGGVHHDWVFRFFYFHAGVSEWLDINLAGQRVHELAASYDSFTVHTYSALVTAWSRSCWIKLGC